VHVPARWGVEAEAILEGSGLSRALLEDPSTQVPLHTLIAAAERARTLSGEPAIGVYAGLALRANHYGYLGFATMCAPTMRAALALAIATWACSRRPTASRSTRRAGARSSWWTSGSTSARCAT
jgi:hypothetical protein